MKGNPKCNIGKKKSISVAVLTVIALFATIIVFALSLGGKTDYSSARRALLEELRKNEGTYDEEVVALHCDYATAQSIAAKTGGTLNMQPSASVGYIRLAGQDIEDFVRDPMNGEYLSYVTPGYELYPETTSLGSLDDTYALSQEKYLYSRIGLEKDGKSVTDYTRGKTAAHQTRMVIIDTGVEYDHEEFLDENGNTRISPLSYSVTDGKTAAQGGYGILSDSDTKTPGHGTLVCGVVFANADNGKGIAGLAPDVELIVVKMTLNSNGGYVYTDFLAALDYAATLDPDVVNLSLGSYGGYNYYHSRIKAMTDKGTVVVGAAGNSSVSTVHYPSADENVVSVGAFDNLFSQSANNRNYSLASYSSFGDVNVDICAPGKMYSTKVGNTYGVYNGTSFASPVVASAVALYISVHPDDSRETIVEKLYSSAYDQGDRGKDYMFGYGGLDTWNFLYGERGTVTFDDGTGGTTTQPITVGTALQSYPYPTTAPSGKVFDGWYLDANYTKPVEQYTQVFADGAVVYAKWSDTPSDFSFDYTFNTSGEVILKGYYGGRKELFLPETLQTASGVKKVSGIAAKAFYQSGVTKIVLPDTIETVGEYAFAYNTFEYVYLPDTIKTLHNYAFYGASGNLYVQGSTYLYKTDWDSGSKMTSVKNAGAFTQKDGMELLGDSQYTLLSYHGTGEILSSDWNITEIYPNAFADNSTLREISLSKVKTIGASAFKNCTALYRVDFPAATSIGEEAFSGCSVLQTYTMPGTLQELGKNAFKNCADLYRVDFSSATALTKLSDGAFSGCSSLQTVDLSGATALRTIGRESFRNCTSLFFVSLPDTVETVEYNAFGGCTSLTVLRLPFLGRTGDSDETNRHLGYAFGTGNPAYQGGVVPTSLKYVYVTKGDVADSALEKLSGVTFFLQGKYNGNNTACTVFSSGNFATWELYADGELCGLYGGAKGSAVNAASLQGCYTTPRGKLCEGWNLPGNTLSNGKATMISSENSYRIVFVDHDGSVLSEKTYRFGEKIAEPSEPSRASTAQYSYRFVGWDKSVSPATEERKYTAVYEANVRTYKISFTDSDGTILSSNAVAYGATPIAPVLSDKSVSDSRYDRFVGWDKEIVAVTGDAVYRAVYQRELRRYTVVFRYEDGSIFATQTYRHGETIVPPDSARTPDAMYTYTFKKWDKTMTTATENAEYTAIYEKTLRSYTVRFENYDGTLLSEKSYHYGETVTIPADPTRESSAEYSYVFNGWSPAVTAVSGDATYRATFKDESKLLTVLFKNYDGTLISSKEYYAGETLEVPSVIPSRDGRENDYYYVFDGWSPSLETIVNENADYKAQYTRKYYEYIVMFLDSDGSVISSETYRYGASVKVPSDPADKGDYVFVGWDQTVSKVTGEAVYTAVYEYSPYIPSEEEVIASFRAAVAAIDSKDSLSVRYSAILAANRLYEQIVAKESVETEYALLCTAVEVYNADAAELNGAYDRAEKTALGVLSPAKIALALTAEFNFLSAAAYVCGLTDKIY